MKRFQNILVPTDFGDASAVALDLAVTMAEAFHSELTLLHVWQLPVYPYMEVVFRSSDLLEAVEQAAAVRLAEELARARQQFPRAQSQLKLGGAWQEIIDASKALDCDLIVMGTHGRNAVGRVLLGSVTEKVVRLSTVPVLTVHAPSAD